MKDKRVIENLNTLPHFINLQNVRFPVRGWKSKWKFSKCKY